jgi:hypothetical protein
VNNYLANGARFQPVSNSSQAHDDSRVRRLIEEMQNALILIPHCIAIIDMLGRSYAGRRKASPRDLDF